MELKKSEKAPESTKGRSWEGTSIFIQIRDERRAAELIRNESDLALLIRTRDTFGVPALNYVVSNSDNAMYLSRNNPGAMSNARCDEGITALHAAVYDHETVAMYYAKNYPDILAETLSSGGKTPALYYAITHEAVALYLAENNPKLLAETKCSIDAKVWQGSSILHEVVRRYKSAALLLVRANSELLSTTIDDNRTSALDVAKMRHPEVEAYLTEVA